MNIRRIVVVATTVATLSSTALPVLANGPDFESDRGPKKESIRQRIMDKAVKIRDTFLQRREDRDERKQEHEDRLSEKHKDRIAGFWERAVRRMNNLLDRLDDIADRLENRLDDLEEQGKNVAEQREKLQEARDAIDAARQSLDDSEEQVQEIIENNEPREAFRQIRSLHRELMGEVRAAHRALIDAIKSVRGLSDVDRHSDDDDEPTETSEPEEE